MNRTFKLITLNKRSTKRLGRYVAASPMAAAKKAFTQYCRRNKKKARCAASVGIQETTSGSTKKCNYKFWHSR